MVQSNTAFPRNFGHYLLSFSHQQERLMRIMNEALWVLKCENTRLLHIDIKSISAPYFKIWEVKWELFTILIQTFKKYIYCTIFKEIVISKEQKDWKKPTNHFIPCATHRTPADGQILGKAPLPEGFYLDSLLRLGHSYRHKTWNSKQ